MIPLLRSAYLAGSAVPGVVLLATRAIAPWLPKWSGCVPPEWLGPYVLAIIGAYLGGGVLAVLGAALWLRDGLRGRWDTALAVASVVNASPLVYVVVAQPAGPW